MDPEDIIEKIVEETELDREETEEKVEAKMDEFEGLVSEEGAVHLVAKEHGVNVGQEMSEDLKIENIVPDMRKVNFKARVVNISDMNTFERDDEEEDGRVQNVVLGDDTGTIRMTLWDEQTDIADKISEGDPIEITGAYTMEDDRGNAEIRLGDSAKVAMADEEDVPEVETGGAETEEASIREVNSENSSYRISGMLMAVYTNNPFYRVDPETGDTVRENDEGEYETDDGEVVENPGHRLALSGVLDDGTGNIRVVFFGEQARKVLEIDEETEKEGDIETVEEAGEEAVGKELEVEGRTRYNDYFGRIELLANSLEQIETGKQLEELLDVMEV
ncbi:MAG: OB-fold nucleic acid binding domain-containing protein [Candidatus Nanohaloarchaea archaeon]